MSSNKSRITFIPQGAIISSFVVGDQNIVQTFPSEPLFRGHNAPYFGETIGRVSNRIGGAEIVNLNGKDYPLYANNGTNSLHGGKVGWGKQTFDGPKTVTRNGKPATLFTYTSPDGDEGFPGTVTLSVWYTIQHLSDKKDGIQLDMEYEVEFPDEASQPEYTTVAVTNHSYFNLSGKPTIDGHIANFGSIQHLPVDENQIPTGKIEPFPGLKEPGQDTVFGASEPKPDHCFIIDTNAKNVPLDTRSRELKRIVTLKAPDTGIHLEVSTTDPAFQFYTGEGIDAAETKAEGGFGDQGLSSGDQHGIRGENRGPRAGIAIEPSRYVDCVNRDEWKGMVLMKKGAGKYGSLSRYVGWRE